MMKSKTWLSFIGVFALGLFTLSAWAQEKEEKVSLDQVPAAVKAAIQKEAGAGTIGEIERETKEGKTVYEVDVMLDGKKVEIKVAEDGTMLGKKTRGDEEEEGEGEGEDDMDTLTMDQIPEPARAALLKLAGTAKIAKAGSDKEHGVLVYEAEWEADGVKHDVAVTADGMLVETEETVSADKTPAAVIAAIAKFFAKDTKLIIKKKTIVVYEIEAQSDGKEKELVIFPTGRVHDEKEMEHGGKREHKEMKHGDKGKKHEEEEDDDENGHEDDEE